MNNEIKNKSLFSDESRELTLFAVNDYATYTGAIQPAILNLAKKVKAGSFDNEKAATLFYHVATVAAKNYARAFFDHDTPYYAVFRAADRRLAAAEMLSYFMDAIDEAAEA